MNTKNRHYTLTLLSRFIPKTSPFQPFPQAARGLLAPQGGAQSLDSGDDDDRPPEHPAHPH